MHDEGLLAAAPEINHLATKLCGLHGPLQCYLVGSVVITGPADGAGKTLPLGPCAVAVFTEFLDAIRELPMPRLVS